MPEGVQFDEDTNASLLYSKIEASSQTPKMVSWVVEKGWAKSEKTATWVLLAIAGAAVLVAVLWPVLFGGEPDYEIEGEYTQEVPS